MAPPDCPAVWLWSSGSAADITLGDREAPGERAPTRLNRRAGLVLRRAVRATQSRVIWVRKSCRQAGWHRRNCAAGRWGSPVGGMPLS